MRWLWTGTSKDRITAWRDRTTTGNRIEIPIRNSHLELRLYTSLFHSRTKLQEICLEPFALIGTLASIKIEGDIDPAVRKQLVKRIKSLLITTKSAIEIGNDHLQRGDIARRCGDHLEACNVFEHGHLFICHVVEFFMASSKISKESIHTKDRILLDLMNVLRSRLARELLYIGQFKPANNYATRTLTSRYTTDVDRLNLLICKGCARLGLWDDEDEEYSFLGHEYDEFRSVMERASSACIRTYFETFPSADKRLEAFWIEVAVDLKAATEDGFVDGIQEAISRAQNELLRCSTRYLETLPGSASNIVSALRRQLLLKRKKEEGSIEWQITDVAYARA